MAVGVLTSGGDCPGLNAAIRAVVRRAEAAGTTVIGFHDAWRGVLENSWVELDREACRGLLPRGGTVLGTSRVSAAREPGGIEAARRVLVDMSLDGFIVIGGDGSLAGAQAMHAAGVPCIGVPKTIDNDVGLTETSFGFDTAVQTVTDAIDRLHSTAESHDRVMVVEVMGRHTGHIALHAGIAGGATAILVPEERFDIGAVAQHIVTRHRSGKFASIVVVAEGALPAVGTMEIPQREVDRWGHERLGGIGRRVADELSSRTGFEARSTELGYIQRGGSPSAFDRVLATRFGIAAMGAALDGEWGSMAAVQADTIVRVPLSDLDGPRPVAPELLAAARWFAV